MGHANGELERDRRKRKLLSFCALVLASCGKSYFKAAFSGTATLACAGFAALNIDAQPRVAVLFDFFRNLFSR